MPRVAPIQESFSGGEIGPKFFGRVSADRFKQSLETCLNYLPTIQGGLLRRSGTYYVSQTQVMTNRGRLIEYIFSQTQSYMLEFAVGQIRIFRNYGRVLPDVVDSTHPYSEDEIQDLRTVPTTEGLVLLHPLYPARLLIRITETVWTSGPIVFTDGPYMPTNETPTTLTPSGTTGNVTVTASGTAGINDGAGFQSTDIGRLIRIRHTNWTWGVITNRSSTTSISVSIQPPIATVAGASSVWRLGLWSNTTGYPSCGCLHEDRLILAGGNTEFPLRIDGSRTSRYFNFAPSDEASAVLADSGLSINLQSKEGNFIRWVETDEKGLIAGTAGGEHVVSPSTEGEALTASNVAAKQPSSYGSLNIHPARLGEGLMFASRTGRQVREMNFTLDRDGFRSPDRTVLADHISGVLGFTALAVVKEPKMVLWGVREDGLLASMTYERDGETLIIGWARHQIGGVSDEDFTNAVVESIAVMPSPDGKRDDIWMIVRRTFGSDLTGYTTKRYIEYMTQDFDDTIAQKDAFFVDCGLTYDNPIAITAVSFGSCIFTSAAHGLVVDDAVKISEVVGMKLLNDKKYYVDTVPTVNTFTLRTVGGEPVSGPQLGTYVSGGVFRKYVSTISGLSHLNELPGLLGTGAEVGVLADGAKQTCTISEGAMALQRPATTVQVGIKYKSRAKLMPFEVGASDGTSVGKTRRIDHIGFKLHRTLGLKFGMEHFEELTVVIDASLAVSAETTNPMNEIHFRNQANAMDTAVPLFTGYKLEEIGGDGDYNLANQICIEQSDPFPGLILNVAPQVVEYDRG